MTFFKVFRVESDPFDPVIIDKKEKKNKRKISKRGKFDIPHDQKVG